MFGAEQVLNADNWGAFAVSILYERNLTPEDSFTVFITGKKERQKSEDRMQEIDELRSLGMSWPDIGKDLGLKNPQSYHCHRKKLQSMKR